MRLLFVDNLLLEHGSAENVYLQPHLGLISLVAVARAAGHEASIYDPKLELARGNLRLGPSLYRDIAGRILEQNPDVVGMTSLGCNFICTLKIAGYLKARRPRVPILVGGPHATILDQEILTKFPQFDVVVRNEAELTLLPVLDAVFGGDFGGIAGVTYRTAGGVTANPGEPLIADLDSLPFPAFDSYPLESYRRPYVRMEAGRGCPFKCSFCSTATFFGRRYRLKSPQRIVTEMDYLHQRYGYTDFRLTHDLFTVDRRKVMAFCQHIRGRGYTWGCSARMDCVDDELLTEMAESGCRDVYYGVETGSPRMQKIADKHLDVALVEPRLTTTSRLGMASTASFITGFPEEEQADQDQTLDLMGRCFVHNSTLVQLHLLTPEPGTGLTQRLGDAVQYDGHLSDFNFPTLESDDASVMQSYPGIFMNHHFYPTVLPRRQHVFVTSVYIALQGLGNPLLAHFTELGGGRFSQIIHDMDRWATETGQTEPYDEGMVCSYVEQRWPGHYLASLFRFLRAGRSLAARPYTAVSAVQSAQSAQRKGPAPYRLVMHTRSEVLRGIHNAPAILERLAAPKSEVAPQLPLSLERRRLDLLIYVPEGSMEIRTLELESGSSALARFLSEPRSMAQVRAFARSCGIVVKEAVGCVRQLQEAGVVVEAEPARKAPVKERSFARNRTSEARKAPPDYGSVRESVMSQRA